MLAEWILSASALTAAMLVLRLVFRRRISPKLQYWLWLPVLARLLIPVPLFHARYSVAGAAAELAPVVFAEVTAAPQTARPDARPEDFRTAAPQTARPEEMPAANPPATPQTARPDAPPETADPAVAAVTAQPAPVQPKSLNAGELLARLWLAGSVASGLWLLGVNLRFSRRLRAERREMRRQGRLPVYVSPEAASPCLFGLLRPAIYLTEACEAVPEGQLRQILLHEETHYKQLDCLWGSLRCLALAVWWWNPLVWLAALCSRRDGELCCDEKVMHFLGEEARLDYGRTLVALLPAKAPRPMLSAATLSGGARAMKERLDRIVKKPRAWVIAAVAVLLLALVAVGCTFAGRPSEIPKPEPRSVITDLMSNHVRVVTCTGTEGELYTLRKGGEGFDAARETLLGLQGVPCEAPEGLQTRRLKLYQKWEWVTVHPLTLAWGEGKTCACFDKEWFLLEDFSPETLLALFEGGERTQLWSPAPDTGNMTEDGSLAVMTELPVYELADVHYGLYALLNHDFGEGTFKPILEAPSGTTVNVAYENKGRETICCEYADLGLEFLREGTWVRLHMANPYSGSGFDHTHVIPALAPGEHTSDFFSLLMFEDLEPGDYRICVPYTTGEERDPEKSWDHVAYAYFRLSDEKPEIEPEEEPLLKDMTPEEIDSVSLTLHTWETYTLRRGMEGFDEAAGLLFSLRGIPCQMPAAGPSVQWTLDFGKRAHLEYDGKRVRGFFSDHWLDLSTMGRPDEELAAIFERYGERYVPEAVPVDFRGRIEDGSMTVTPEHAAYDYQTVQTAIAREKQYYLATGERSPEPDGDDVKLILENHLDGGISRDDVIRLEALRDGVWVGLSPYSGYASLLTPFEVPAGETKEAWLPLHMFNDPLPPGRYRVSILYSVPNEDGTNDLYYEHVAFGEFEIGSGAPAPAEGAEPLLSGVQPEKVQCIRSTDAYGGSRRSLLPGNEGFGELTAQLLSLRGTSCPGPGKLPDLRITVLQPYMARELCLVFDGEKSFMQAGEGWYELEPGAGEKAAALLDACGKEDQLFLREAPDYSGLGEDGSLFAAADRESCSLEGISAAFAYIQQQAWNWKRPEEKVLSDMGALLAVELENRSGQTIRYGFVDAGLELLREGRWYRLTMAAEWPGEAGGELSDAYGMEDRPLPSLEPGEKGRACLSLAWFEGLCAGDYRICIPYRLGDRGEAWDHVTYVDFRIGEALPAQEPEKPKVYIPIWQDYPASEDRSAYHLSFRVPAGWSSVDLSPEEAAQQGLLYLPGGTEDRHYLRDERGRIIGAFGCASYEASEEQPEAIYAALAQRDGWGFDVEGSYAPVFVRECGENARVDVVCSGEFLGGLSGQTKDKVREGALSYDRALGMYAAVELEPGLLTEEEMTTLAISLYMEHEENAPAAGPEPVARITPEPEIFGSYEEARADTEAISFQWVDKPHSYERAVKSSDPITFDLERAYPGFGTLLCGHLADASPHGDPTYLFFLTEDGERYALPAPWTVTASLPLDTEGGTLAAAGEGFQLVFPAEDRVRWWMSSDTPINVFGNLYDPERMTGDPMLRGGTVVWDLDLDTMEVSVYYQ